VSALFVSLLGALQCADGSTLTLRDGTIVSGEIVSLNDGAYVVKSAALGTLTIKQADVATVTEQPTAPAAADLHALQEQMAADPATVSAVAALQDDPDVQAILSDPALLAALRDGNLEALLSNPKIARLASDPRVQDITKKVVVEPSSAPDTAPR
jgi:hypothetical protein